MTGPPRTLTTVQFFELLPYPPQSCRSWLDWNAFGKFNSVQFQPLFPRNSWFWSNRSSVQSFLGCFSFAVCLVLAQSKSASPLFTLLHAFSSMFFTLLHAKSEPLVVPRRRASSRHLLSEFEARELPQTNFMQLKHSLPESRNLTSKVF